MRVFVVAVFFCSAGLPAYAAEATCTDYSAARDYNRGLFDGYIYGFVNAKISHKGDKEVNSTVLVVKDQVDKFCAQKPDGNINEAIREFTLSTIKLRSDPTHIPRVREECEEASLKLAYPPELKGCIDPSVCKSLTSQWLTKAANFKRLCLRVRLGE